MNDEDLVRWNDEFPEPHLDEPNEEQRIIIRQEQEYGLADDKPF